MRVAAVGSAIPAILGWSWPARAVPLTDAEVEDVERAVASNMRLVYGAWLAKAGSTLVAGSPAWDDPLRRTAAALLSGQPDGCPLAFWLGMGCGRRVYDVPSWSMLPTILDRDVVSTLKAAAKPVRRGDVVACRVPSRATASMHRVIDLPGDRVGLIAGVAELNGRRVPREPTGRTVAAQDGEALAEYVERAPEGRVYHVLWPNRGPTLSDNADMAEVTVSPDHYFYFVLGDNRSFSLDSRSPDDHGLPAAADVLGVLQTVVVSRDPSRIGSVP